MGKIFKTCKSLEICIFMSVCIYLCVSMTVCIWIDNHWPELAQSMRKLTGLPMEDDVSNCYYLPM